MKLIHCADLHLDSKMTANLDKEQAKERNAEILHTFERMVDYAVENEVKAILIAGDMFDTRKITAGTRNRVMHQIKNTRLVFYYLKGNHDYDNFLADMEAEEIPSNLKLFHSEWTNYEIGNVVISGIELSEKNSQSAYLSLGLDARKFNIVMMHGQEAESNAKDKAEIINLKELRNKSIDYLALGHVHTYKRDRLDARGIYCYPGCLEGRGFDECGEHGFVVLDIDEETGNFTDEFVSFAERKLYTVTVDVTGCQTTAEMSDKLIAALSEAGCEQKDIVKAVLTGAVDVECEKDVQSLLIRYKSQYYFMKIYDETKLRIDASDYMLDESLKGEFVRMVMKDTLVDEEDKKAIIRYGLQAIAGEEVQ